ncbi:MAG TPA: glycosyltransferase family 2 protein [Pyrinomonadaceae bacterium]|jgi:glycosyltransferase involved in cell wall biosynthesis
MAEGKERAADKNIASDALDVSIVVPVYRNAETLRELHDRLCRVLESQSLSFEILFINDACPADSMSRLCELASLDGRVGVIGLERNVGQHRAVMTGLVHARGSWAVLMDADLQDRPEIIPALLEQGSKGFSAVFAGRRGQYESRSRLLTSALFKRLLHSLCGVPVDAGLFVALDRKMVQRLLEMACERPHVTAIIGCTKLPCVSIPVRRETRPHGSSAYTFWKRLKSGCRAVRWVIGWKLQNVRGLKKAAPGEASANHYPASVLPGTSRNLTKN